MAKNKSSWFVSEGDLREWREDTIQSSTFGRDFHRMERDPNKRAPGREFHTGTHFTLSTDEQQPWTSHQHSDFPPFEGRHAAEKIPALRTSHVFPENEDRLQEWREEALESMSHHDFHPHEDGARRRPVRPSFRKIQLGSADGGERWRSEAHDHFKPFEIRRV